MTKLSHDFSVGSLNVRGLNNIIKRQAIFKWIKNKNLDIFMLQECYSGEEDCSLWEDEWGGRCLFSHGSKHSRGTMILFKPGLDIEIMSTKLDMIGRYIIVKLEIQGEMFVLVNVYAPNKATDKEGFFKRIKIELETMKIELTDKLIVGGDWNTIFNIEIDKKGGNKKIIHTIPNQMRELIEIFDLVDIWRISNPTLERYTFRQKTPLIQTRLDYFLISNNLQDLIVKTNILPSIRSDHSVITLSVKHLPEDTRGSSHWKFNSSLLQDKRYIDELTAKFEEWRTDYSTIEDKRVVWDLLKYETRKYTMKYCSIKKKESCKVQKNLELELNNVEEILSENPSEAVQRRYEEIIGEIKQFEDTRIRGEILRSKVKWSEEGEKSSHFFLGLAKQNYVKKHMRKIEVNKEEITDPKMIQYHQKCFYENLYKTKLDTDYVASDTFTNTNSIKSLTEAEKLSCDRPIEIKECEEILATFANNKSPGNNGLTFEFYSTFRNIIKILLMESFKYAFVHKELSTSQKQGVITLLEKQGKNRKHLENWRPISLLNFDYKLLTKLLSNRIKEFLPQLIHPNQVGFIKGRFIGDAIRIIQDLIEYTNLKDIPGLLLFIDFEKAFDTLEWKFIWQVFEKFNFGNTFIRWLHIIYKNPVSCILNNGFSSSYFGLERGVRQGDPLSPYIFILAIELLAEKIRTQHDIRGLHINDNEIKMSLYADDMTVAVQDIQSAKKVFDLLTIFAVQSGLKVNRTKTEGMWIGKNKQKKISLSALNGLRHL